MLFHFLRMLLLALALLGPCYLQPTGAFAGALAGALAGARTGAFTGALAGALTGAFA